MAQNEEVSYYERKLQEAEGDLQRLTDENTYLRECVKHLESEVTRLREGRQFHPPKPGKLWGTWS
jgi:predicted nuclease with TOPRIM domain